MHKISKVKILSSIIFTILAVIYALPNFISIPENSSFPNKRVNLGLDLRGGSHLLIKIDFGDYLSEQISLLSDQIRREFRNNKIGYVDLKKQANKVNFSLRNSDDLLKVKKIIRSIDKTIIIQNNEKKVSVEFDESKIHQLRDNVFDRTIEIIRMRVDSTGTKEPVIQRQGEEFILLQVPGEDNPEKLKAILGQTAKLTFHKVLGSVSSKNTQPAFDQAIIWEKDNENIGLIIEKKPTITGDMLLDARAGFDNQRNIPVVSFEFNNLGAKIFGEYTKTHQREIFAIVLDNTLLSAPVINEPILGGRGTISGNFTLESAEELAVLLRSGSLPVPLKIIEERTIGPNLGADSIEAGKKAGMIGFAGVVIFMAWTYGIIGIFANIALVLALIYIVAMLSLFQATLTLPGIAGIILTIGMAVDANVLIYERIREEVNKSGASILYSIKNGFDSAFATILDSNITTLIAALLLYIFGTGPIKGFAVTLTIGIIASMFTSIIIAKLLIDLWMKIFKPKSLYI